ncbi:LIM/homeobox protein Lhx9 [Toxocara canis]|uniref:LIM/homeobox protein Lhx9 n=1 Tax=Toxocara canis TaxID=6265 RepID=A0A0B2VS24_TOXCA|nr:LIM/homeobox protein Lhx9 [Toxocara canis]
MSGIDVPSFGFPNLPNFGLQVGGEPHFGPPQVEQLTTIQQVGQRQRPPEIPLQTSSVVGAFGGGHFQLPEGEDRKLSTLMIYLTSLDENLDPQPLPLSNVNNANTSTVMAPAGECAACLLPIVDQYFLMIGERSWHSECLRCCLCGRTLHTASSCFYKDGLVFCREDYTSYEKSLKFSKRCERCASILSYDDVVMRARDAVFHLRCFTCVVCSAPLHPGELFAMGDHGTLYCQGEK